MRPFWILLSALMIATPAAAQKISEGETFLSAVRDLDGATALPLLEQPGSRIANFKGYDGETALHIVTRKKALPWVGTLLRHGADPNEPSRQGETPLTIATQLGWFEGATALLRGGAKVNQGNRWGETPLMMAVRLRNKRLVELLMENGADPDQADHSAGLTARDYAKRDNRNPELLAIIESGGKKPKGELTFGPIIELP